MTPSSRRPSTEQQQLLDTYQQQLLTQIAGLTAQMSGVTLQIGRMDVKIDESLTTGRDSVNAVKLLRADLGLDGPHGRLPQIERRLSQLEGLLDSRIEKTDLRIGKLEDADQKERGKRELISAAYSLLGGSMGAAAIGWIAHALGWIH